MPAGYETGTATSPVNLLQKLVTWLVAQGWMQNMSQADGTGWRAHLNKGGVYANLRAAMTENVYAMQNGSATGIALYLGSGFSSGSNWRSQAGGPIGIGTSNTVGVGMQLSSGAITAYHFFDDGSDNIVVVVERSAGIFTNMGWGVTLNKVGAWIGGPYFFAAQDGYDFGIQSGGEGSAVLSAFCPFTYSDYYGRSTGYVRADIDSFTNKWLSCLTSAGSESWTGKRVASPVFGRSSYPPVNGIPHYTTFQTRQTSLLNAQANLLPINLYAERDAGGYSLLGDLPGIYWSTAVGNGYTSGSIYPIGADSFMVFPNFAILKRA
jgi:hypothetical protein